MICILDSQGAICDFYVIFGRGSAFLTAGRQIVRDHVWLASAVRSSCHLFMSKTIPSHRSLSISTWLFLVLSGNQTSISKP